MYIIAIALRRLVAGIFLAFLSWQAVADHPDLEARERIVIAGSVTLGDMPTRLAGELGLFGAEKPAIELISRSSGGLALAELLAQRADFALTAVPPFVTALTQRGSVETGEELVILARISRSNKTHHAVVAPDARVRRPEDLAGLRVGIVPDSTSEYFWSGFAPLHGLTGGEIDVLPLAVDDMIAALAAGKVDAVVVWDPWVHRIREALGDGVTVLSDSRVDSMSWLLVTRRRVAEAHPALCDRVLEAYLRAESLLHEAPERALELEARLSGLALEDLHALAPGFIYNLGLDWSLISEVNQHLGWLQARDGSATGFNFLPEHYLAPEPLLRAAPTRLLLPQYWRHADAAQ